MAVKVFELVRDTERSFKLPTYNKLSVLGDFLGTSFAVAAHVSLEAHKHRANDVAEGLVDRAVGTLDGTDKK
jgi:hypothetical protein